MQYSAKKSCQGCNTVRQIVYEQQEDKCAELSALWDTADVWCFLWSCSVYNYFCVRLDKSTWSRLCLGTDSIVENVFTIVFHEELDQRLSRNPRLPDHLFVHLCRLSVLTCRLVLLAFDSSSLVWICKRVDRSDLQSSATSLSGRVVWKMIVDWSYLIDHISEYSHRFHIWNFAIYVFEQK